MRTPTTFHGVLVLLAILFFAALLQAGGTNKRSMGAFPMLMYNSDIGFGFGGRGTVKNLYRKDESFDLILFASSKGEQWYAFTFSMPDFELHQGKRYPLAQDFFVEYNKRLKSNFLVSEMIPGTTSTNSPKNSPRRN